LIVRIDKEKNTAMQSISFPLSALTLVVGLVLTSCQKDTEPGVNVTPAMVSAIGNSSVSGTLPYSSTVFYYREQAEAYIESPQKNQSGTYGASPKGLVINPTTGAIDVNKSESGLTYQVWFKPTGSSETSVGAVTIAGINFQSRIYNLALGDAFAKPLYNVQNNVAAPSGVESKVAGSEFANDNDKAIAALLNVNTQQKKPKGLEIDSQLGTINLRRAVANGVFGDNPVDGTVRNFRLYYRLNDASKKALNYIDVRLHYYSRVSAVPSSLLSQASYKSSATFRTATPTPTVGAAMNVTEGNSNEARTPRPPDIIIVGD